MSQKISAFPDVSGDEYKIKDSYIAGIYSADSVNYENIKINIGNTFYTKNEVDRLVGGLSFEAPELKVSPNLVVVSDSNGKISTSLISTGMLTAHIYGEDENDNKLHITSAERSKWNNHITNSSMHISSDERSKWDSHIDDTKKHITDEERTKWNTAVTIPLLDYTKGKTIQWDTTYRAHHADVYKYSFNPKWLTLKRYDETSWVPAAKGGFNADERKWWSAGNDVGMHPFYAGLDMCLCARGNWGRTGLRYNYDLGLTGSENKRKTVLIPALSEDHMYFLELRALAGGGIGKIAIHWRKNVSSNNNIINNKEWSYIGTYLMEQIVMLQLPIPKNSQIAITGITIGNGGNNAAFSVKINAFPFLKA